MKFITEVYLTEILPYLKQLIISIVRGIRGFVAKILHVFENPWSSITGVASQKDDIEKAFQHADWLSFCQGVLLVLGALAIYDSPLKNWGVVKEKLKTLSPPTPQITHVPDASGDTIFPTSITQIDNVATDHSTEVEEVKVKTPTVVEVLPELPELPYEYKITINKEAFIKKVHEVAERLQIKPSWLMIVMWIESTFNRGIVNKYSGTVGLIQWTITNVCEFWGLKKPHIPTDKKGRIIITPQIKRIHDIVANTSGVEQLEKAYEYFEPYIGKMKSVYDVYLAVFYPYAIGKHKNYELGSERSVAWLRKVYQGNKALDLFGDRDGKLEYSDVIAWVDAHVPLKFIGKL